MCLDTLPNEILQNVLLFTLPDLTALGCSTDRNAASKAFTHPVLQVCSHVRRSALVVLNTRYGWMTVRMNREAYQQFDGFYKRDLPVVSDRFLPYIDTHAPCVRLDLGTVRRCTSDEHRDGEDDLISIVLPFNFDVLLHFLTVFKQVRSWLRRIQSLDVWYQNMNRHVRNVIHEYIVPTLATVTLDRHLKVTHVGCLLNPAFPGEKEGRPLSIAQISNRHLFQAEAVVEAAQVLARNGHDMEAGLLLLYNRSLGDMVLNFLPTPQTYDKQLHGRRFDAVDGSLQRLNQLRNLLWYIDCGSVTMFAQLYRTYGHEWCRVHDFVFDLCGIDHCLTLTQSWFGLSKEEMARWHCRQAVKIETDYRIQRHCRLNNQKPFCIISPEIDVKAPTLKDALIHSHLAEVLDKSSGAFSQLRDRYEKGLGDEERATAKDLASGRFMTTSLDGFRSDGGLESMSWAGDRHVFEHCSEEILKYLPMAREGVERPEELATWIDSWTSVYIKDTSVEDLS